MNADFRRKLAMADRVRDFVRAQPADQQGEGEESEGYAATVARLEELVVRAKVLAEQQVAGQRAAHAAVLEREMLRIEIRQAIAVLSGVAAAASDEVPELLAGVSPSLHNAGNEVFQARVRAAHATAVAHGEVLARYGLPAGFTESLGGLIARFDEALHAKHGGEVAKVGASAELEAIGGEIMRLVKQLDAIHRYRFRADAERLGAWRSVRNVAWRASKSRREATPEAPSAARSVAPPA